MGKGVLKRDAPVHVQKLESTLPFNSARKRRRVWLHRIAVFGPLFLLTLVIWLDQIFDVSHVVFGTLPDKANWPLAVTETVFVILAGILVSFIVSYATRELTADEQDRKRHKLFSDILISESPTLFLAIRTDGSVLMASNSLLDKLGYSLDEVLGKNYLSTFIPIREQGEVAEIVEKLIRSESPAKNENYAVSREGKEFLIQWEGRVAYQSNGDIDFVYAAGTDITERKKTELALRQSEERYRSFIQKFQGIAYRGTLDYSPVFFHGSVEEITGYSEQDFLRGSPRWDTILHPEDAEIFRKDLESIRTVPNYAVERTYRIIRRDGQTRWVREYIQNMSDPEGIPAAVQGMIYDITTAKEVQDSLRKSDERYRLLAENVKDVIWVLDRYMRYTYISPSVERLRGYRVEEAMGLPLDKMFTPRSYKRIKSIISQVFVMQEKGEISDINRSLTFESELLHKDGTTVWVEVTASFAFDANGLPAGFVGVTRDISERKKTEEAIRQREEIYRTIFENTGTAMIITEHDTTISLTNDEFEKLSGYTKEELEGKKSWKEFVIPEDLDRLMGYHANRKADPVSVPSSKFDFRFLSRQGLMKDVYATVMVIPGTTRAVVSLLDITETKKASEELQVSREQLRNLHKHSQDVRERERTRVAREIHDELGQVLTALKMDLSYLAKKLPPEFPSLRTKTNLMLRFVDMTIQSVKRITMDLRPGLLDHLGLVAAIEWQADEFQKRTGIRYSLSVDPEDIILNPDSSTSIFRIFQETLTNIARHAHATEIKISLLEKDGILELTVSDNGIGISKDQIENAKSFGLMGIKERAYFSGGQAKIFGKKGKGTTVQVSIPFDQMRILDDTSAYC